MCGTLQLLNINIEDQYLASIAEVLSSAEFNPVYHTVYEEEDINQALNSEYSWDLIILSDFDAKNNYPTLTSIADKFPRIPIIFFTKEDIAEVAKTVMVQGATDCVSPRDIGRLAPIIKREITRRRMHENYNHAIEKKEILSSITESSTEEVFLFNYETLLCYYANSRAIQKSGYSEQDIYRLTPADLYAEYSLNHFKELVLPLLEKRQESISICTNIKRKTGVVYPAEIHLRLIEKAETKFILSTNKDISGLWYKIQKLKRQRNLTEKYIRKNTRKANFLADAAHDMRTSINSIILSNKLLAKHSNEYPDKGIDRFINAIYHSGSHLLNYIDEFFDSPNEESDDSEVKKEPINIPSFSNNVYQTFAAIADKKEINFNYQVSDFNHEKLHTNPTYLKRIIKNLLSNAFKYTQKGSVSFKVYAPKPQELEEIDFGSENAIAFQIKDTGIGIPKSQQDQIFERHNRVDHPNAPEISDGSGLGLNICKELTEALDGNIHIESKVGIGSTFTLYLPVEKSLFKDKIVDYPGKKSPPSETPDFFTNGKKSDKTILIIDDSMVHNLAIKELLSFTFNNCITTTSKTKGYQILKRESIDCIILDYILVDSDSIKMAKYLKNHKLYSHIPIIIYTGKILRGKELERIQQYTDAVVKKNTESHKKLITTIHSCLRSNTSIS
ncbi:hybrid sensor histidine kinase/response regulator [Fodinibius saliphilus]|uniref:hybrid sensor histidine kinase/response regulator n=1 Tax=Fodinibius saliphilus TaxID=1920650 RepID=UPI001109B735|nr:ATP-binding protein [Fodinibius saliphilus]